MPNPRHCSVGTLDNFVNLYLRFSYSINSYVPFRSSLTFISSERPSWFSQSKLGHVITFSHSSLCSFFTVCIITYSNICVCVCTLTYTHACACGQVGECVIIWLIIWFPPQDYQFDNGRDLNYFVCYRITNTWHLESFRNNCHWIKCSIEAHTTYWRVPKIFYL